jgi:hypothetical protein
MIAERLLNIPWTLLSSFVFIWTSLASEAEPNHPKYMGTGSCSSSNCHGSVNALTSSQVLQNEYHTWLKLDKHSKAYAALLNEDSQKIASHLGIAQAEKEPLCLKCHSTYVPSLEEQGPKYQLEDGVSCESCHNASEQWLKSHSVAGTTHEQNLENGLANIAPLDKRATMCLSCHFGNEDKTVNHNLYGAGHPRLSFELDTFGVLQPKHWVVDEDYRKRKADYVPVITWLVGQTTQAVETLAAIESPKRSKNGWYPELSLFDCYSCHHSLTEEQWKKRTYGGQPGELHLNLPSLMVLREAVTALNPTLGSEFRSALNTLHSSYKNDGGRTAATTVKQLLVQKVMPLAVAAKGDAVYCRTLLRQLSSFASSNRSLKYEMAEQVGMGMQALLASAPELGTRYKSDLDAVFATLKSAKSFGPEAFSEAAGRLNGRMGK